MVNFSKIYDKHYKKIVIIPLLIFLFSIIYLVNFYNANGDIMHRDVSLTGGTSITLFGDYSSREISEILSPHFNDVSISVISDNLGKNSGVIILIAKETPESIVKILEEGLEIELDEENSSVEFTGDALGSGFYTQLTRALIFAFVLMSGVVFFAFGKNNKAKIYSTMLTLIAAKLTFPTDNLLGILIFIGAISLLIYGFVLFKNKKEMIYLSLVFLIFVGLYFYPYYLAMIPVVLALIIIFATFSIPSISIVFFGFTNIIASLSIVNLLGMRISSAGIIAFLMLVGYSVDTNILLTTKALRRKESVNKSIWRAFKTGAMMTATSMLAVGIALIFLYRFESIFNQIFLIILLGLGFDLVNTWVGNGGVIKWYLEKKK